MRDSCHASEPVRFGPAGSYDYAGHGFPATIRHAIFAEQGFCSGAIAVFFGSAIEGADGKYHPLALHRQRRKWRSRPPPAKRRPQSMRGARANVELGVERQFEDKQ